MGRLLTRGHPAAAAAVQAMVAGRPPHAIVLAGASGSGKTTLAVDLAAGLLCDAPEPADRPCRECRGCRLVDRGTHADLHRLAPAGPGLQVRIGDRGNPEPGTVRRLIADLALLPVEGGRRVAIIERADRLNEDAQSALLKILEEPPAGVTIVLCADRDDLLLPTVLSRCVRVRLGPVPIREIEAILADAGGRRRAARQPPGPPRLGTARRRAGPGSGTGGGHGPRRDRPDAARPGRRAGGAPSERRARAAGPGIGARGRAGSRELCGPGRGSGTRSGHAQARSQRRGSGLGRGRDRRPTARRCAQRATRPAATDADAEAEADAAQVRVPATERRRAAAVLIEIWRDVARDLLLVELGEERRLRDPALLDDLRGAATIPPAELRGFIGRLARSAELLEANVSPELAVDALLLAWPRPVAAA